MILLCAANTMELASLKRFLGRVHKEVLAYGSLWNFPDSEQEVVALVCGVGKLRTALSLSTALQLLRERGTVVSRACMVGIAGGVAEEELGTVHLPRKAMQWDLDLGSFAPGPGRYSDGSGVLSCNRELCESLESTMESRGLPYFRGTLYSGDRFLKGKRPGWLEVPGTVDMESAAFLETCRLFELPAAVLRLVSDNTKGGPKMHISRFVKEQMPRLWACVLDAVIP